MDIWMSMSIAPRDGNPILGVNEYGDIAVIYWGNPYGKYDTPGWRLYH